MVRRLAALLVLADLGCLLAPGAAFPQDDRPLSRAQAALFDSDHLKKIQQPVVLEYAFRHDAVGADSFADKVEIKVTEVHGNGKKDVAVDFLTGDRRVPFPPVSNFSGNPLLMYFLEYDVINMQRMTGGSALYFRNRIRNAFASGADMHPVNLTLGGASIDGTEIVIRPFTERNNPALQPFLAKVYHFVLSDDVPGTLYQVRSEVPGESGGKPQVAESVTYVGERP